MLCLSTYCTNKKIYTERKNKTTNNESWIFFSTFPFPMNIQKIKNTNKKSKKQNVKIRVNK